MRLGTRIATLALGSILTVGFMPASPASAATARTNCSGVGGKIVASGYLTLNGSYKVRTNKRTQKACAVINKGGDRRTTIISYTTGCGSRKTTHRVFRGQDTQSPLAMVFRKGPCGLLSLRMGPYGKSLRV